ncbi:MAG: lycopene cyclase domain-containing protein [Anaerolineae bacterium]|nr:lycopene cyclase domain-containing protein [Anaerolineae bacterium]
MPYAYLIWLVVCVGLPLGLLWVRCYPLLARHRWALGWTTLGGLVLGWLWNASAVRVGIWYYTRPETVGVWLLGLPIEEWLWMGASTCCPPA